MTVPVDLHQIPYPISMTTYKLLPIKNIQLKIICSVVNRQMRYNR